MNKQDLWAMFYGQIAGIQYHPANPEEQRKSLEDMAEIAYQMVQIAEVYKCRLEH